MVYLGEPGFPIYLEMMSHLIRVDHVSSLCISQKISWWCELILGTNNTVSMIDLITQIQH